MKKCKLSLLALVLMTVFMVTPAVAKPDLSGFYVGVKFIDSIQGHWGDTNNRNIGGWGNTVGGALFAGYDFYYKFDVPIRTELEYALRSDWTSGESWSVPGGWIDTDVKVNVQTLLLNVYYDFRNSTKFTPYIGAGIGLAFTQGYADSDGHGSLSWYNYNDSAHRTDFAWQVGAGVAYAFTDNVSADLGYRYLGLGSNVLGGYSGAHEFSLGIRITF